MKLTTSNEIGALFLSGESHSVSHSQWLNLLILLSIFGFTECSLLIGLSWVCQLETAEVSRGRALSNTFTRLPWIKMLDKTISDYAIGFEFNQLHRNQTVYCSSQTFGSNQGSFRNKKKTLLLHFRCFRLQTKHFDWVNAFRHLVLATLIDDLVSALFDQLYNLIVGPGHAKLEKKSNPG